MTRSDLNKSEKQFKNDCDVNHKGIVEYLKTLPEIKLETETIESESGSKRKFFDTSIFGFQAGGTSMCSLRLVTLCNMMEDTREHRTFLTMVSCQNGSEINDAFLILDGISFDTKDKVLVGGESKHMPTKIHTLITEIFALAVNVMSKSKFDHVMDFELTNKIVNARMVYSVSVHSTSDAGTIKRVAESISNIADSAILSFSNMTNYAISSISNVARKAPIAARVGIDRDINIKVHANGYAFTIGAATKVISLNDLIPNLTTFYADGKLNSCFTIQLEHAVDRMLSMHKYSN